MTDVHRCILTTIGRRVTSIIKKWSRDGLLSANEILSVFLIDFLHGFAGAATNYPVNLMIPNIAIRLDDIHRDDVGDKTWNEKNIMHDTAYLSFRTSSDNSGCSLAKPWSTKCWDWKA